MPAMQTEALRLNSVLIEDTFAEAFRMWAARVIVTAEDEYWLATAGNVFSGYGTSVIACDAEVGREVALTREQTPDGRPGEAFLLFGFSTDALAKALPKRVGQCLMTCPTTAVYDGLPAAADRLAVGKNLRYFGDGYQKSKVVGGRRYWRIPVMEGEFVCEDTVGAVKAVAGGNFLIEGRDLSSTLAAARVAAEVIAAMPDVITPFPGGVVRSGSKVGSRYKGLLASSNEAYDPALRSRVKTALHPEAGCVLELVINGLSEAAIAAAMRAGIEAACAVPGVVAISAGNYGGKLGKFHFRLREVMGSRAGIERRA